MKRQPGWPLRLGAALAAAGLSWAAALQAYTQADIAELDNSHPPTSQESSQIQDYTRTLSKEWLKEFLDIDLDAIGLRMRRQVWQGVHPVEAVGQPLQGGGNPQGALSGATLYSMDLHLEQYDDIRRLQSDLRDIPFALRFDADSAFFGDKVRLKTSLFVPLSWKDELRAQASMPMPSLAPAWMGSLLNWGGFNSGWDLKSSYGNRLGVSSVQTGLGTQWMKLWNLDYEISVRYGEDNYEESQWLKLDRSF